MQKHSLSHSKSITSMVYCVPATTFLNILIGLAQYIPRMVRIDSSHGLARPWANMRRNAKIRSNMNGVKPKRCGRGNDCCELATVRWCEEGARAKAKVVSLEAEKEPKRKRWLSVFKSGLDFLFLLSLFCFFFIY